MRNSQLIAAVEKLVNPIEGGAMHVLEQYNHQLPIALQNKLIKGAARKHPYMGFIVEPYAQFNFFKINDVQYFEGQVQDNFKLIKSRAFIGDEEDYYLIIGSFNVRTSAFFGNRIEAYVICEDIKSGLLTWVIIDVLSNTISYEPRNGLMPPNAEVFVTTGFDSQINVFAKRDQSTYQVLSPTVGSVRQLDERLWLEGNLSVGYGRQLSNNGDTFGLLFDVREVEQAIAVSTVEVTIDNWFQGLIVNEPKISLFFPYAQHFISASPGSECNITTKAEMEAAIEALDFERLEVYSSKGMFRITQLMLLVMALVIIILVAIVLI